MSIPTKLLGHSNVVHEVWRSTLQSLWSARLGQVNYFTAAVPASWNLNRRSGSKKFNLKIDGHTVPEHIHPGGPSIVLSHYGTLFTIDYSSAKSVLLCSKVDDFQAWRQISDEYISSSLSIE